ncbi:MAG TPA: ornithine--oxo-acid transaminase [Patescibacteria group bacterium]|nr:ornithine--oxo-acid transaminase [Patescibacteria group bacterium]
MAELIKTSEYFIDLENRFGARNYKPLDVVIEKGDGVWVTDVNGKTYIDMLSAYSALNQGHRHPRIVEAAQNQLNKITLTSRAFRNDQFGPFIEKLSEITNKEMVLPMNSGSEAVETALKTARKWGYKNKLKEDEEARIIVCRGNFHGRTISVISFSTEEQYRDGFGPYTPGFDVIPYGDTNALENAIKPNTVGFLVEPIQGEGGVIVPPKGYLRDAFDICRKNNVLFMADEIQTGLGRTGKMFACDHENVIPDVYILGKALSGGILPLSAVVANKNILGVFEPGDHGSTFGGNPLASAVGLASLNVLVYENLAENSAQMGEYFQDRLKRMESPHVKDIRGKGLLIGVELEPAAGKARGFCERLQEVGVLAKETHDVVVRFAPPLIINKNQIDWAMEGIESVFK